MFSIVSAQPQRSCATMEDLQLRMQQDPGLVHRMQEIERGVQQWISDNPSAKLSAVVTIPVVVHVVYNTAAQNISDAQVLSQIDVLNEDFRKLNADASNVPAYWQGIAADCEIQFCMAQRDPSGNATTGIVRKSTTVTSFSSNNNIKFNANGGSNAWASSSYLNIWVGNLSGGLLGYAQFPGGSASTDGVVIHYTAFGRTGNVVAPFNKGRTATHEVGHWLNLYHIWGDDGTSCNGSDQVSDTPNQADETYGCYSPGTVRISCSNGPNGDMWQNYMDYTDDACMYMFTTGQKSRMTATLNGTRASLLTSQGCVPPVPGSCDTPSGLSATSVTSSSATLNWASVSGATSYNINYKVSGAGSWTATTSATNSKNLTGLSASTLYEYQVQADCGGSASSYSSIATFTTSAASCSDPYEPNQTRSASKTIPVNTDVFALIGSTTDLDWFKFNNTTAQKNIQITLTNLPFDYDVRLYSSSGTLLATSQLGGTASETIKWNTSTVGTYHIRVYGYNGAYSTTQCYKLRADISSTPWKLSGETENAESEFSFTVFPNPANDYLNVNIASTNEKATVELFDVVGKMVHSSSSILEETGGLLKINLAELKNGIYLVRVSDGANSSVKRIAVE